MPQDDTTNSTTIVTNATQPGPAEESGNLEIYEGLVMGVGRGTVAVVAFGVVGLIICFFKDCSSTPSVLVALGIIIPLLVLLIVWVLPKQSLNTDIEQTDKMPSDPFRLRTGFCSFLIFFVCLILSILQCGARFTT